MTNTEINNNLKYQLNILEKNFNSYSIDLSNLLVNLSSSKNFLIYQKTINMIINKNPKKLIETFIIKVLIYEEYIMNENDKFFLGELEKSSKNDDDLFEFKSIWLSINISQQNQIKSYMKLLCQIARKYFDLKYP